MLKTSVLSSCHHVRPSHRVQFLTEELRCRYPPVRYKARGWQTTSLCSLVAVLPKPAVFHVPGDGAYKPFVISSELGQAIYFGRAEHNGRNQNDPYRGHRMFVNKARMLNAELLIVDIGVTHFKSSTDLLSLQAGW